MSAIGARAMRSRFAFSSIVASTAFLSAAFSARGASARDCTVAADCPRGYDCEPSGTSADGGASEACSSLPCKSDSDCGPGTRCDLSMGAESRCAPQWQVPCTADADCGPGFTCSGDGPKSWNCGAGQDASEPPYVTSMIIPCSDVPPPGPPGFDGSLPFDLPPICKPGTSCLYFTWKVCAAQQTPPCTVDSDCPSTWTCQCPMTCRGIPPPPPGLDENPPSDAACTKACVAPNSDLSTDECGGEVGFGPAGGVTAFDSGSVASGGDGSSASREAPSSGSSQGGGCLIGADEPMTDWPLAAGVTVFAWAIRRKHRRDRP
jgi:Dickkopf-like protein